MKNHLFRALSSSWKAAWWRHLTWERSLPPSSLPGHACPVQSSGSESLPTTPLAQLMRNEPGSKYSCYGPDASTTKISPASDSSQPCSKQPKQPEEWDCRNLSWEHSSCFWQMDSQNASPCTSASWVTTFNAKKLHCSLRGWGMSQVGYSLRKRRHHPNLRAQRTRIAILCPSSTCKLIYIN